MSLCLAFPRCRMKLKFSILLFLLFPGSFGTPVVSGLSIKHGGERYPHHEFCNTMGSGGEEHSRTFATYRLSFTLLSNGLTVFVLKEIYDLRFDITQVHLLSLLKSFASQFC